MKVGLPRAFFILSVFLFLLGIATGAGSAHGKDIEGSKDHPMLSRYAGSVIIHYEETEFDEYFLPIDKRDDDGNLVDTKRVTGKVTRIQYKAPEGRSTLEVYSNYEAALKDEGFEIIFSGTQRELGWGWTRELYLRDINPLDFRGSMVVSEDDFRYLSAKLDRREENAGKVYVSLCVAFGSRADSPGIQLDVVETKPMEKDKVKTDSGALAEEIHAAGAASIHDLYFDTGKAEIKPESKPALEEIAELLEQETELTLYVVGHTDIRGDFNYNMTLSKNRAEAVVETLVSDYDISRERLRPHGVGPLAPTATNETEEGRRKNRRVELVKF